MSHIFGMYTEYVLFNLKTHFLYNSSWFHSVVKYIWSCFHRQRTVLGTLGWSFLFLLLLSSLMAKLVDHYKRNIHSMTLENHDIIYIYIANVHSIVIFVFFHLSFYHFFSVSTPAYSSLFSDILNSLFVHTFVIVYFFCVYISFVFTFTFDTLIAMGGTLTKSKNLSISGKTKEQQKEIVTTTETSNNHIDVITNEDDKKLEKTKNKKKKEAKPKKKSSEIRVDKSTNTESCILPSTSFTEQLVGEPLSVVNNNLSSDVNTTQVKVVYQSDLSNQDVKELRDACYSHGIVSTDSSKITEEVITNNSVPVVANGDQVDIRAVQDE